MEFNTQICTTIEQSERLLALGLKKETADCRWIGLVKDARGNDIPKKKQVWSIRASESESAMSCGFMRYSFIPAWSLHRLMALCSNSLYMSDSANAHYRMTASWLEVIYIRDDKRWIRRFMEGNIYDRMINMIKLFIENDYFNKEYLEEKK